MSLKNKNPKIESDQEIKKLIQKLKKYDEQEYTKKREIELEKITDKLISVGNLAVPYLIEVLDKHNLQSSWYSADALGDIGDTRAIKPLVDALEEPELGENAMEALKKFGEICIPEVIKKVEWRIAHPVEDKGGFVTLTMYSLTTIGEIKCDESIKFLNKLLDDYMSEMPDEIFDPTERDWKYKNVDFFHLIDCMVKQQDERAIPHIKKAMDFFPKNYTEYKICQIAIGRIKKKRPDEGYLPLEALEIAMPSGSIMAALSGGKVGWEDTFDEKYGEYFEDDEDNEK